MSDIIASEQGTDTGPAGPSEVHIAPNGVFMPLGRILLVRKDADYCVVKFNKFWTGKTEDDIYAIYESYYQDDKTGDFSNDNVKYRKDKLISPKGIWIPFWHTIAFGSKKEIECGPIRLWWTGKGSVYFFKRYQPEGDYGIELAPTKWTDISQVNVFDPIVKWYKYDEQRERVNIPIDQLWEDKEK